MANVVGPKHGDHLSRRGDGLIADSDDHVAGIEATDISRSVLHYGSDRRAKFATLWVSGSDSDTDMSGGVISDGLGSDCVGCDAVRAGIAARTSARGELKYSGDSNDGSGGLTGLPCDFGGMAPRPVLGCGRSTNGPILRVVLPECHVARQ